MLKNVFVFPLSMKKLKYKHRITNLTISLGISLLENMDIKFEAF